MYYFGLTVCNEFMLYDFHNNRVHREFTPQQPYCYISILVHAKSPKNVTQMNKYQESHKTDDTL